MQDDMNLSPSYAKQGNPWADDEIFRIERLPDGSHEFAWRHSIAAELAAIKAEKQEMR